MDLRAHLRGQRGVHQTLALDAADAAETLRDYQRAEMAPSTTGARMTSMKVALVHHLYRVSLQGLAQALLDAISALHTASLAGGVQPPTTPRQWRRERARG